MYIYAYIYTYCMFNTYLFKYMHFFVISSNLLKKHRYAQKHTQTHKNTPSHLCQYLLKCKYLCYIYTPYLVHMKCIHTTKYSDKHTKPHTIHSYQCHSKCQSCVQSAPWSPVFKRARKPEQERER